MRILSKKAFSGWLLASVLIVAGCASLLDSGGQALPDLFTISGTVTLRDSGVGLAGATVTLAPGGATATTDASGAYTIGDLAAATYTATPSLDGFFFDPVDSSVTLGPSASGVDFVGTALPVHTFTISGTVTDTDGGAGLAGVTITVAPGGASATTASDGTYAIADLEAGDYTVSASLADYTFDPASSPVTLGPDATGVDFAGTAAAPDTFSISGTVTDTNGGAGLAGVTLTLTPGGATATSGGDGSYSFSGLAAGDYTVTPTLTDYTFAPVEAAVTVGPSATGVDFAGTGAAPVVTYTGDIKAILDGNCTGCHSAGFSAGGVALDTYADAVTHANATLAAVQGDSMPPGGPFLSAAQKQAIADWIAGGMIEN